jgi:ankyrin repeat protein
MMRQVSLSQNLQAASLAQLAFNGHLSDLKSALNSLNVNSRFDDWTPLMWASFAPMNRGLACAEHLLMTGADADLLDAGARSAMHLAALRNNVEVVELLLAVNRRQADWQTRVGDTPLSYSAVSDSQETARLLLDSGANAKVKNRDGFCAADIAKQNDAWGVVQILVTCERKLVRQLEMENIREDESDK